MKGRIKMKILAIGDIVGDEALEKVIQIIPKIKKENNIDFIIANGENIVKARGINKICFEKLVQAGVDAVTMGNHTYSNKEIYDIEDNRLIVPANYNEDTIYKGYKVYECNNNKIFVANLIGKGLGGILNPFKTINNIINNLDDDIKIRIIDFHGEYGNEKRSIAHMLKNKISVVFGTHTHVQTADEKILYDGVGFITDIGMCGAVNSAIGYDLDFETKRYLEELKDDSILAKDKIYKFNACVFDINELTGKTINTKRINIEI